MNLISNAVNGALAHRFNSAKKAHHEDETHRSAARMSALAELDDPRAIALLGEQIYAEKYKQRFEAEHPAQFAAIDIHSQQAFVAEYPEEAIEQARASIPECVVHLVRIGSASAYRMSFFFASDDAGAARIL
ncbi:hypothetical protein [Variovorax sp. W2I14]|uniref:hypothetical protein n=1 Tax=Variovorax sp. W2I14 TaxID=3042290 RepID=UPI003D1DC7C2